MAITADAMTVAKKDPPGKTLFFISFSSADANGGETVKAAPSSGAIYITEYQVSYDADAIGTLGDGTTDLQFIGTATGLSNPVVSLGEDDALKLADTTALTLTAAAGNVAGHVKGFVA